jgi:hypothetical protein
VKQLKRYFKRFSLIFFLALAVGLTGCEGDLEEGGEETEIVAPEGEEEEMMEGEEGEMLEGEEEEMMEGEEEEMMEEE